MNSNGCFEYQDFFLCLIFLGFYTKYAEKSARAPLLYMSTQGKEETAGLENLLIVYKHYWF